jgi:hypothetical protein
VQDEQIAWLKAMKQAGMLILWQPPHGDDFQAVGVVGFSTQRPHIMFVAKGDVTSRHPKDKNAIVEMDVRNMAIGDFIVLHQIQVPDELRDPVVMNL